MTVFHLVQHGEKARTPGDPGLTDLGHRHAALTGAHLRGAGLTAVYSSDLLRARQTAGAVADACGLTTTVDRRVRERMNWDGTQPVAEFLADWERTVRDREFTPVSGDSSRVAGERFRAFLLDLAGAPGPVAVATHGGVTVDLLRTLGADVPDELLWEGVPSCAITTLDDLTVRDIASRRHLT
ncbi:histidine phosphatase family protein [Longispora sp. NPDC051575]|uniref:histidine phosphatase family protein n=1 Tax=Longispora sp. NPDC051575 TaxID=3154943 RepID=UPI0034482918